MMCFDIGMIRMSDSTTTASALACARISLSLTPAGLMAHTHTRTLVDPVNSGRLTRSLGGGGGARVAKQESGK
jgi:hypothetical protein